MYARRVEEKALTFDFAEGLVKNNLLIVDRETQSIWSQLEGKAVSGPLKNTPLKVIPTIQTTWKHWRTMHPETRVMMVEGEKGRPYLYRNWQPGTPRSKKQSKSHDTSALGLGLVIGNKALFFPFRELDNSKIPLELELDGKKVTIHYKNEALTAWAEDSEGNLLPGVLAYKEGWLNFHPNSEVFRATKIKR